MEMEANRLWVKELSKIMTAHGLQATVTPVEVNQRYRVEVNKSTGP